MWPLNTETVTGIRILCLKPFVECESFVVDFLLASGLGGFQTVSGLGWLIPPYSNCDHNGVEEL